MSLGFNVSAQHNPSLLTDVVGWVLLAVSLMLPIVSRDCRRDRRVAYVVWVGVLTHQAFALYAAYFTGLRSDAGDMHELALRRLGQWDGSLSFGGGFYVQFLSAVYEVLSPSSFLGQQLSILAYALSCLVFLRLLAALGVERHGWLLLALFALPLSMLRYTSTTIREAYQILFFALAIFWAIRFLRDAKPAGFLLAILAALAAGIFHDAMMINAMFLVGLLVVWPMASDPATESQRRRLARKRLLLIVPLVAVAAFMSHGLVSRTGGGLALRALTSNRALEYAARYRERGLQIDARTTYGVRLNTSSAPALAVSLGPVFVYYMFSPFPWQVRTPEDVYGAVESLLRFALLVSAIAAWRGARGPRRRIIAFLLACCLSLAFLWSVGTVNYGTAIRHHLTTTWLLILVGGPGLVRFGARWARSTVGRRALAGASA
jgi:hypothetical protein